MRKKLHWLLIFCFLNGFASAGDVARVLDRKIDTHYWNCFLSEILSDLHDKYGLQSECSAAVDKFGTFTVNESAISVKDLLQKVADEGKLVLEFKGETVFVWRRADDKLIEELAAKLQNSDRWVRCAAAWDLAHLGDKRVYSLLNKALADDDPGVGFWTVKALAGPSGWNGNILENTTRAQLTLIASVEGLDRDALTQLLKKLLASAPVAASAANAGYFRLLGAANTEQSIEFLLRSAKSRNPATRANAFRGLVWSKDVRALDALIAAAGAEVDPTVRGQLVEALSNFHEERAADAILALIRSDKVTDGYGFFAAHCCSCLSRMNTPHAGDAVLRLLSDPKVAQFIQSPLSLRDPRIESLLATRLKNESTWQMFNTDFLAGVAMFSFLNAGDPRVIEACTSYIKSVPYGAGGYQSCPEELAHIRDPRALRALLEILKSKLPKKEGEDGPPRNWGDILVKSRDSAIIDAYFTTLNDKTLALENRAIAAKALAAGLEDKQRLSELIDVLEGPANQHDLVRAALVDSTNPALLSDFRCAMLIVKHAKVPELTARTNLGGSHIGNSMWGHLGWYLDASPTAVKWRIDHLIDTLYPSTFAIPQALLSIPQPLPAPLCDPALKDALFRLTQDPAQQPLIRNAAIMEMLRLADVRTADLVREKSAQPPPKEFVQKYPQSELYMHCGAACLLLQLGASGALDDVTKSIEKLGRSAAHVDDQLEIAYVRDVVSLLAQSGDPRSGEALASLARNAELSTRVRSAALAEMQHEMPAENLIQLVIELLKDPGLDRVSTFTGHDQNGNIIEEEDNDFGFRLELLQMLPKGSASIDTILRIVRDESVPEAARERTVLCLNSKELDAQGREKLRTLISDQKVSSRVRLYALGTVAGFSSQGKWNNDYNSDNPGRKLDPQFIGDLLGLYHDPAITGRLHEWAASWLARYKDSRGNDALRADLKNIDEEIRLSAACALLDAISVDAFQARQKTRQDADSRFAAADPSEPVEVLLTYLQNANLRIGDGRNRASILSSLNFAAATTADERLRDRIHAVLEKATHTEAKSPVEGEKPNSGTPAAKDDF